MFTITERQILAVTQKYPKKMMGPDSSSWIVEMQTTRKNCPSTLLSASTLPRQARNFINTKKDHYHAFLLYRRISEYLSDLGLVGEDRCCAVTSDLKEVIDT